MSINRHLAVFMTGGDGSDIYGLFVDCNGNPAGNPFFISNNSNTKFNPVVAFDTTNNRFLVAWEEFSGTRWHIWGALLDSNGGVINPPGIFAISDDSNNSATQGFPDVVFGNDSSNNPIFAVIWNDTGTGTAYETFARVVNPTNPPLPGAFFNLSNAASDQYHGSIAYNSDNRQFLVVWQEGALINDIYGRRFDVNAGVVNPLAAAFLISNNTANHNQDDPKVAYDPVRNQYLTVWDDDFGGDRNVYGILINATTEALIGSELNIATSVDNERLPQIAYFPSQNSYLVAWRNGASNFDVYGQYIDALTSSLSGGNFLIVGGTGSQSPTSISYNSTAGNLVVSYVTSQTQIDSSFIRLGSGCSISIPIMSEWGIIIFVVLAGLGAVYYIRRQRRVEN